MSAVIQRRPLLSPKLSGNERHKQYLGQFLPLWAVVLVSSIGFGLAHSYQGASGVVRVTLIGLAFGVFYALTGSIWLAMLAHAVLDILQGAYILEVLGPKRQYPHPTAPAGRQ